MRVWRSARIARLLAIAVIGSDEAFAIKIEKLRDGCGRCLLADSFLAGKTPAGNPLDSVSSAQGATKLQPTGSVGPQAAPAKTLLFRYQIAVWRVLGL